MPGNSVRGMGLNLPIKSKDFETPEGAALTLSVLADFVGQNQELLSDRILRCIVFAANGDLNRLEKAIDLTKEDYRDLVVWAEYDEKNERVRDLTNPFFSPHIS